MIKKILGFFIVVLAMVWFLPLVFLTGPDYSEFDNPHDYQVSHRSSASPENKVAFALITQMMERIQSVPESEGIQVMRDLTNQGLTGLSLEPSDLGVSVLPVSAGGVPAEWVLAPNADSNRRLIFLHGGGFLSGSPKSHRGVTAALSKMAGIAVLAVDYRLMPENKRSASIEDSQTAYLWMIENGPQGAATAVNTYVAGDSAGGNLTLMMTAWLRDNGHRQVDAAVAFSPAVDSTSASPSYTDNIATDPALGPMFGEFMKIPKPLRLLLSAINSGHSPSDPMASPLFNSLQNLPPTEIHTSDAEMLLGDSIRYTNKAKAAGSPVDLKLWPGTLHAWQILVGVLPESTESLQRTADFFNAHVQ